MQKSGEPVGHSGLEYPLARSPRQPQIPAMTAPKPTRSPIPGATDDTVLTPALRLQGRERAQPVVDWLLAMRLRQHRITLLFDGFVRQLQGVGVPLDRDRKSTRLNSSH